MKIMHLQSATQIIDLDGIKVLNMYLRSDFSKGMIVMLNTVIL